MREYALIILNANHTLCLTHRWQLPLASGKGLKGELGTSKYRLTPPGGSLSFFRS